MTREEIAKAARTVLTEAIDAFQELARETQGFSDLQPVTVYLKHVRAVADSQLSKLHQDAGNGEWPISTDGPHQITDHRLWLARQLLDSKLSEVEAISIVKHFPADALERGSQVVEMPSVQWISEQAKGLSSAKDEDSVGALAWNLRVAFQRWVDAARSQVGDGWVLVPREPTGYMLEAVFDAVDSEDRDKRNERLGWFWLAYRSMLAAAPAYGGGG